MRKLCPSEARRHSLFERGARQRNAAASFPDRKPLAKLDATLARNLSLATASWSRKAASSEPSRSAVRKLCASDARKHSILEGVERPHRAAASFPDCKPLFKLDATLARNLSVPAALIERCWKPGHNLLSPGELQIPAPAWSPKTY